jgi:hypothetical protein
MNESKKYLFIARESEYKAILEMAKLLIKDGVEAKNIIIFFIDLADILFHHSDGIKQTKAANIIPLNNIIDMTHEFKIINSNDEYEIDLNYIKEVEKKYGNYRNLWVQAISDYKFIDHHHWQYFNFPNQDDIVYYFELYYKKVEKLFSKYKFNFVLDLNYPNIGRSIIYEVARYNNIPYMTPVISRIKDRIYITKNFGLSTDEKIIKLLDDKKNNPIRGREFLLEFNKERMVYGSHVQVLELFKLRQSFLYSFIFLVKNILYNFRVRIFHKTHYVGVFETEKFSSVAYKSIPHWIKYFFRNNYVKLFTSYIFKKNRHLDKDYILYPLHAVPENSTIVNAPYFLDEIYNITLIARSMPIEYKLFVKEHIPMIGDRPIKFYRAISKIPNVVLISPYDNTHDYISNAKLTISITGTAAFESLFFGKPSIVLGDTDFESCHGVFKLKESYELHTLIRQALNFTIQKEEVESFISAIYKVSESIDIRRILYHFDSECLSDLKKLYKLYTIEMANLKNV